MSAQSYDLVSDMAAMRVIADRIRKQLMFRKVRVRADSDFNNQPYGHSRKKWAGSSGVIAWVCVDPYEDMPTVMLAGASTSMSLDELELL